MWSSFAPVFIWMQSIWINAVKLQLQLPPTSIQHDHHTHKHTCMQEPLNRRLSIIIKWSKLIYSTSRLWHSLHILQCMAMTMITGSASQFTGKYIWSVSTPKKNHTKGFDHLFPKKNKKNISNKFLLKVEKTNISALFFFLYFAWITSYTCIGKVIFQCQYLRLLDNIWSIGA